MFPSASKFFTRLGLTDRDVDVMITVSQWASIGGSGKGKTAAAPVAVAASAAVAAPSAAAPAPAAGQERGGDSIGKGGDGLFVPLPAHAVVNDGEEGDPMVPAIVAAAVPAAAPAAASAQAARAAFLPSEEFEAAFSREAKAALGVRCKRAIDECRACKLVEMGYETHWVRCTERSLEDLLLVGLRPCEGQHEKRACVNESNRGNTV